MRQKVKMKAVSILALLATIGSATGVIAAPDPEPKKTSEFNGNVIEARDKIFAGLGGENGIGMTRMWPRVTIPALSSDEISTALSGNTVRTDELLALYFVPDGSLESWFDDWTDAPASACTARATKDRDFVVRNGVCQKKEFVKVTGSWTVRNNMLCPILHYRNEEQKPCWYVALIVDRVVLFGDDGAMLGQAKVFRKGRVLDQIAN